ncbi:inorganic triphosphatase [Thalassolituus sp. LLYu03]|uniref:CYTH domain-containing protein n=1 Tax=Thalassolituus sp. LLYu03 TaxID=3421656 RepID=UPI003D2C1A32
MTKETELKLRLSPDHVPALVTFLNATARPLSHSTLKNWYLDTPEAGLSAARAALRIRQKANGYEQTLKTRGTSLAGLQLRGEWNWPLSEPVLNTVVLQSAEVAAAWPAGLDMSRLGEVFTTHFERQAFEWQAFGGTAEVVIDQGEVCAGAQKLPLCEVELELKDGDAVCLWRMAQELAGTVPLWLSDISKAERGYRLAKLSRPWHQRTDTNEQDDLSVALPALLHYEFLHLKRALEACLWEGDRAAALRARRHWQALRSLPQLAGKAVKRAQTRDLRAALDRWEQPLLTLATLAQLNAYLRSADDDTLVAGELQALDRRWQAAVQATRGDSALASAMLNAAYALYSLEAGKSAGEPLGHWLRHLLRAHGPLLDELKSRRPQEEERWRGLAHEMALLQQCADYAQDLPGVARGLGIAGGGIGDGVVRVLSDMLGAQTLLVRPSPLADAAEPLRPLTEYTEWALEHLKHLARQI